MDSDSIGPALPPHLQRKQTKEVEEPLGPALPPNLLQQKTSSDNTNSIAQEDKNNENDNQSHKTEEDEYVGPALPPNFARKTPIAPEPPRPVYGPIVPSSPILPTLQEEDDGDVLGPKLPSNSLPTPVSQEEEDDDDFHKNLYHPKVKKTPIPTTTSTLPPKEKKRDDWMTELPSDRNSLSQLGPRTFSKSGTSFKPDDSWTSTPGSNDPKSNKRVQEDYREYLNSNDSSDSTKVKNTGPSLVELHQNLAKKRKSDPSSSSSTTSTFDRERDLTMRQIDPVKRSQMISQAKTLNNNFAPANSKW